MVAEAIILAFLGAAKAELEFLCTPVGQSIASDTMDRIKVLRTRMEHLWERFEPTSAKQAA